MHLIRRCLAMGFLAEEEGAVATEHALLISLIAMVIFGAVTLFGSTVYNALYQNAINLLPFGG